MATQIVFNSRLPQAKADLGRILLEATQQVFATVIHPAAVERSPVTEEGAAINEAMGKKAPHILGTGTNRRSIDFTVEQTEEGPKVTFFTTSGYGGYLEVGTFKMRAQPYMWPAFIENIDQLPERVKVMIQGLGVK